jgi:hypothetical protein
MKQILCEICHERPATNHICNGNTGKSSDFCAECFESSAPPEMRQSFAEMRGAHCQYCDGEVFMGGTDTDALMFGVQQMKYMCKSCFFEHHRYRQQELRRISPTLSQEEQMESLRTLNIAADQHMKKWVSERDSQ